MDPVKEPEIVLTLPEQDPEIVQLKSEVAYLTNQLRFDAKTKGAIGGAILGYLVGSNSQEKLIYASLGGVLGMRMFKTELTDQQKQQMTALLKEKIQRLNYLSSLEKGKQLQSEPAVLTSQEMDTVVYENYTLPGVWAEFLGSPSKNFHAMVFGPPKQGKSTMCMMLMDDLSELGSCLYVAAEEGFGPTLTERKNRITRNAHNNLFFTNWKTKASIISGVKAKHYDFVCIDSASKARFTVEDIREMKAACPNTAFICIHQATKDGQFRGSQEYAHDCDIIVEVKEGVAYQQGRFQHPTKLKIF